MPEQWSEEEEIGLEPIESEEEDADSGPSHYDLTTYPADFTLEVLNQKWVLAVSI